MDARQRAKISDEDKTRIVAAFERGDDCMQLAEQLGIKRSTAYAIIRRSHQPPPAGTWGGSRHKKVDEEMEAALTDIVGDHPTFTLDQIKRELRLRQPTKPTISRTTLVKALTGRLITMKKLEDAPLERNRDETKEGRRRFADWLMNDGINRQELIFIDEAGINLYCARTRGRARRGERAVRVVNGRRGGNLTLCLCISNTRGLVLHELMEGGMTADKFVNIVNNVATSCADDCAIIFDNAPAHGRAASGRAETGDQQLIRPLPPYSPMLNIVEQAISTFKV